MKHFIGKKNGKSTKRGCNNSITVYKVENNTLDLIGNIDFNTAAYKGDESIIFEFLYDHRQISPELYNSNRGYYNYRLRSDGELSIQVI